MQLGNLEQVDGLGTKLQIHLSLPLQGIRCATLNAVGCPVSQFVARFQNTLDLTSTFSMSTSVYWTIPFSLLIRNDLERYHSEGKTNLSMVQLILNYR